MEMRGIREVGHALHDTYRVEYPTLHRVMHSMTYKYYETAIDD